ncbi:hypothetical protein [Escherichia coli ISC7]|uniref:Uncharacterized protein n=1 Tax=Escherichia coli ISC7 TaxID=1432555 RepID=W1EXS6_ECOLX|nr:hypothetical protein [Escherichia coli ISC7]
MATLMEKDALFKRSQSVHRVFYQISLIIAQFRRIRIQAMLSSD